MSLLRGRASRRAAAFFAVAVLSLLMTRAFGSHAPNTCETGDVFPFTGYSYGYSGSGADGTGFGYGYGPCPTPTPTPTATPVGTAGTITLFNSQNVQTTSFRVGESGNRAVLDGLQPSVRYDIDFAQSPGVIIGQGTTNASGDATINFAIPATAAVRAATLTFLPGGSTTNSRTVAIQILAAQATPTSTPTNATPTAVAATPIPVSTTAPTLPRTGVQIGSFLTTSLALLALGVVLRAISRRRVVTDGPYGELPLWFSGRKSPGDLQRGLWATRFSRGN